jgi:hypothetical protein
MDSKPRRFTADPPERRIGSILATALTVSLAVLLAACGGGAIAPTSAPSAGASPAVCSPRGGKAVPAGAARALRRYVDLLTDGRVAAAQRLAAPASPAAAADGARALASLAPRITALDDHY